MKKLIVFVIIAIVLFSGCSKESIKTDKPEATEKVAPVTTDGTWSTDGMTATVEAGVINIYFESDDTKALYWSGTFPKTYGDGMYVSIGNVDAMYKSLMGSSEVKKTFMLEDNAIQFEVQGMGMVKQAKLKKD